MSNDITKRMLRAYQENAIPSMFLSGLFQSPPQNFHNTEEIEIDIERNDENVSIVIEDMSAGYRRNSANLFTNKSFIPPVHKESVAINSFELIKRMPGQNPFQSPDFRANLILRLFNSMRQVEQKIRRSIELQASQVLQTGKITLKDSAESKDLYTLDFKPKSAHFPTSGTAWDQTGSILPTV